MGRQAQFTSNFGSKLPRRKVHEPTFLWFGLPFAFRSVDARGGPLLTLWLSYAYTAVHTHTHTPTHFAEFGARSKGFGLSSNWSQETQNPKPYSSGEKCCNTPPVCTAMPAPAGLQGVPSTPNCSQFGIVSGRYRLRQKYRSNGSEKPGYVKFA